MSIYERLRAKEKLTVQFKGQPEHSHKGPFTVGPLLLIGTMSTAPKSEWARYATVGGVVINHKIKLRMGPDEMQEWCDDLEEVLEEKHEQKQ